MYLSLYAIMAQRLNIPENTANPSAAQQTQYLDNLITKNVALCLANQDATFPFPSIENNAAAVAAAAAATKATIPSTTSWDNTSNDSKQHAPRPALATDFKPSSGCSGRKRSSSESSEKGPEDVMRKTSKQNKVSFPRLLMDILEAPSSEGIIEWYPDGKRFILLNEDRFIKEIIPAYFQKCKFTSFIRKLNRWGFRFDRATGTYGHESFQRDDPRLLAQMFTCEGKVRRMEQQRKAQDKQAEYSTNPHPSWATKYR